VALVPPVVANIESRRRTSTESQDGQDGSAARIGWSRSNRCSHVMQMNS
jgi:hypothetical protein